MTANGLCKQSVADQFRLLQVHQSNIAATAQASRIRLQTIHLYLQTLENYAERMFQQNAVCTRKLRRLRTKYRDVVNTLRSSRLQSLHLREKLCSAKATYRRPRDRRSVRSVERGTAESSVDEEPSRNPH
jgi:hypothetical protein